MRLVLIPDPHQQQLLVHTRPQTAIFFSGLGKGSRFLVKKYNKILKITTEDELKIMCK